MMLAVGSSLAVVNAAEPVEPTVNVVVAEVVSSKLVSLDPTPGMAAAANHWRVTLRNIEVVSGKGSNIPGRVVVDVHVDDTYLWTQRGMVGLVLSYSSRDDIKVLGWSPVYHSICVPSRFVATEDRERYRPDESIPGHSCTMVPW